MESDENLEHYLRLCMDIYLRLKAEGNWPWPDSQKSDDLIESGDNTKDL